MQQSVIIEYLDLMDAQRETAFTEVMDIDTALLWQRPAAKEWSIGENIDHGRVLLRSFRRLLKICWVIFYPYARLKKRRHYETSIDDVYERPGFPLNVGWFWPSKFNADKPASIALLYELYDKEHKAVSNFYMLKQEEILGNLNVYDPAVGWLNLIQALRVGIYHDEHHFRQVRKLYAALL